VQPCSLLYSAVCVDISWLNCRQWSIVCVFSFFFLSWQLKCTIVLSLFIICLGLAWGVRPKKLRSGTYSRPKSLGFGSHTRPQEPWVIDRIALFATLRSNFWVIQLILLWWNKGYLDRGKEWGNLIDIRFLSLVTMQDSRYLGLTPTSGPSVMGLAWLPDPRLLGLAAMPDPLGRGTTFRPDYLGSDMTFKSNSPGFDMAPRPESPRSGIGSRPKSLGVAGCQIQVAWVWHNC
jgi:hypothetical protein